MWRELIITDVTSMGGERVCIAGIDHQGNTFRPVRPYPQLVTLNYLYDEDKLLIRSRAVVRMFLEPESKLEPPHTEDHIWIDPAKTQLLRYADDTIWRGVLEKTSKPSVIEIFGVQLDGNRRVRPGTGICSLGTTKPKYIKEFRYKVIERDQVERSDLRVSFRDASGEFFPNIIVKDLTLCCYADYLYFQEDISPEEIGLMLTEKVKRKQVWLRLGLAREWNGWCFLQMTGIYTFPDYLEGKCFADFVV